MHYLKHKILNCAQSLPITFHTILKTMMEENNIKMFDKTQHLSDVNNNSNDYDDIYFTEINSDHLPLEKI